VYTWFEFGISSCRHSSEMATSCCSWSIPTLPASSSCSPPIAHHEKKNLYLELSLPKTRCDRRLAVSLAESTRKKKCEGNEKKTRGASHTARRTERPHRAAKDASSRPLSPLRSLGPYLRPCLGPWKHLIPLGNQSYSKLLIYRSLILGLFSGFIQSRRGATSLIIYIIMVIIIIIIIITS